MADCCLRPSTSALSDFQAFLESTAVRAALNKTGSALAALTVLKKICDHPTLLNERAASLVARAGNQHMRAHIDCLLKVLQILRSCPCCAEVLPFPDAYQVCPHAHMMRTPKRTKIPDILTRQSANIVRARRKYTVLRKNLELTGWVNNAIQCRWEAGQNSCPHWRNV